MPVNTMHAWLTSSSYHHKWYRNESSNHTLERAQENSRPSLEEESRSIVCLWKITRLYFSISQVLGFLNWLVVLTMLKNISQWEGLSHILWKI